MNINVKVLIFFTFICFSLFFSVFIILKQSNEEASFYEDKLISKSIYTLNDIFYQKSENLRSMAYDYSTKDSVIEFLENNKKELKFEPLNDRYTHFIIYDKKRNLKHSTVYDINSDEYISNSNDLDIFFKIAKLEQYINNKNRVFFLTLEYEKILFTIEKIIKNNELLGYVFIGRTLDSTFLSSLSKQSFSYISLLPSYNLENKKNFLYKNTKIYYDVLKPDEKEIYAHIELRDEIDNSKFYIRVKMARDFFMQIEKNNSKLLYFFIITLVVLILMVYIFISRLFTKRLKNITNVVKKVSVSKTLNIKIVEYYDDEITYLAKKLNEMFASIDHEQHLNLKRQRDFLQSVLDSQENIILITDGEEIRSTNRKFVDFFRSTDHFMTNIALLDNKTQANLLKIAKKHDSHENPAKVKVIDNEHKYFTFDVQKLDMKNYLICMNDVSKYNEKICQLEQKATMDELTHTFNKTATTSMIKCWLQIKSFCLIIYDVDYFKSINDTYGHYIGDCVLRDLSKLIGSKLHMEDKIGRFGGEEFMILLDDKSSQNIIGIANRLRKAVESHKFQYNDITINITISLGATYCSQNEEFEEVYKRADKALYEAKRSGRNKICYN